MYIPREAYTQTLVVWRKFRDNHLVIAVLAAEPAPGLDANYCTAYTEIGGLGCVHVEWANRITTHARRSPETETMAEQLKALGYRPLFNLHWIPPYCRDIRIARIAARTPRKDDLAEHVVRLRN